MNEDTKHAQPRSGPRWRFVLSIVLTVLFGLSLIAANHAAWLVTTAMDTDAFVGALAPLPSDPDVAAALGQGIADTIVESAEVGQSIADALPDGLQFIAIGITESLRDLIGGIATKIVQSDAFVKIWETALRVAHSAAKLFITGINTDVLATEGDAVVLDLSSVFEPIAQQLNELGFDALDGATPDLTIELFEVEGQGFIQSIVRLISSIRWFVIGLSIVLVVGVFATATDRRRTTVWVGSAISAAMLVSLVDIRFLKAATTSGITDEIQFAGTTSALDIVLSRFVLQSWVLLVFGLIIAISAWVMGDSPRALAVRSTLTGEKHTGGQEPNRAALFLARHTRTIEWGGAIALSLVLLIAPLPSFGFVVFAVAALIAFIVAIEFIASRSNVDDSDPSVEADVSG